MKVFDVIIDGKLFSRTEDIRLAEYIKEKVELQKRFYSILNGYVYHPLNELLWHTSVRFEDIILHDKVELKEREIDKNNKGYTYTSNIILQDQTAYDVNTILDKIIMTDRKEKHRINLDGDDVNISSLRLQTFKKHGTICKKCGIEGLVFIKQKTINQNRFHLNLFGFNHRGDLVLMTKDHIKPKSKGGKDHIDNMQTMCTICNGLKGDFYE